MDSWLPLDKDAPKGFHCLRDQVVDECPTSPSPPLYMTCESTETEAVEGESTATTSEHSAGEEEINGSTTPQQSPRHARVGYPSPLRGGKKDNATTPTFCSSEHEQQQRLPPPPKKGSGKGIPRRLKSVWYCCACMNGPNNIEIDICCSICQKRRCKSCELQ